MFKLIKTEFIKIFKKKSFLVVSLIFILYCLFTNLIYLSINSGTLNDPALDIQELEIENNKLNLSNPDDLNQYVSNLTTIALTKYTEKYSHNTQKYLIEHYLKPVISNYYETKYITKETKNLANIEEEITKIENLIAKENWEYFTNENISHYQKELQKELSLPVKSRYETLLKIAEYRLQNNIPYDETHYLHNALNDIATDITEYYNLKYQENLTKEEQARYTYITKELQINKYIIEHKADIHNNSNLRAILKNFAQEFDLFILIYVIMLSGSIVSEEFNKGTIKFLLTKPYKRSTILTSKLLTVLLAIPLIVLFMLIIELIIGGLIFGFSSLSVPVVIYNAGHIITYNIFRKR